jgi:hypothetical protein
MQPEQFEQGPPVINPSEAVQPLSEDHVMSGEVAPGGQVVDEGPLAMGGLRDKIDEKALRSLGSDGGELQRALDETRHDNPNNPNTGTGV